jgi:hypothetical protein
VDPAAAQPPRRARERYWLHALLLVLTLITTSAVGARLEYNFRQNRPFLAEDLMAVLLSLKEPWTLAPGLPFAATLITILLAHEMGHYLTCRYYGIDASLPYFLPAPTLIGTLGAFIRIRSPILWRTQLCWRRWACCRVCIHSSCAGNRSRVFEGNPRDRKPERLYIQHAHLAASV